MDDRSFHTRGEDWATRVLAPLGLMTVMAAAVALIVAGVYTADRWTGGLSPSDLAWHRGVAGSTAAWSVPLALTGIATLFTGIAFALARIRISIRGRRDALVHALPRLLRTTTK